MWKGSIRMEKRYTIGVMIGNANSPHTMNLMQGIFHAAKSMDVNVLFFLGFTVVITINLILAKIRKMIMICLLYTSDAADEL